MARRDVKRARVPLVVANADAQRADGRRADGQRADATLAEAKRRAASEHLLAATRRLVGDRGLDVTMDEIAEASGVSRRTLFRHFESRERLIAAAFATGMQRYGARLPEYEGGDWRVWLRATCEAAHRMNASYGPGYWQLTTRRDLPEELARTERKRRTARRGAMSRIAETLWRAAGHAGVPPKDFTLAVGAHLSAHFTAAVVTDVGGGWQAAADEAFRAIADALERHTRS
jgi:AcrR family transcriptional regulator